MKFLRVKVDPTLTDSLPSGYGPASSLPAAWVLMTEIHSSKLAGSTDLKSAAETLSDDGMPGALLH